VILPEMRGTFEDELLRSQGRKLARGLNLAYSQAITINQNHRLRIDSKEGRYTVERPATDPQPGLEFVPLKEIAGAGGMLDQRITIEIRKGLANTGGGESENEAPVEEPPADIPGDPETIAFYPDGTAEPAEIVLTDRAGFGLSLRVNPVTARVQIVALGRK
jgi:hypothetical protein